MKIAPYWIREVREIGGLRYKLRAFSFRSAAEARERLEAKAAALRVFHSSRGGAEDVAALRRALRLLSEQGEGEYEVVMAEPIVQQVDAHNVITRNRYGAEVLNSDDTCFLDVDVFAPGLMDRLRSIFGRKQSDEERLLAAVGRLCAEDATLGVRVYRTARGWRLLAAGEGLAPDSARMEEICARLQVDKMYAGLCRKQRCWRARLTPKPGRMGLPPYPCPQDSESTAAAEWLELYAEKSARYAVCRLVECLGEPVSSDIVALHDERTGAAKHGTTLR